MEALGINVGYLLVQILGIWILYLAIKGWMAEPITKVLEDRKATIAKGLEDSRQAAIARDNADAEAKKILEAARAEAAKIRSESTVQAEEAAKAVKSAADEDAKRIVAAAGEDALVERDRMLSDLRGQVASIAIAAANKIVGESLSEDRQHKLVGDFFAKVPADVASLSGDDAEVTSALPLSDDEKAAAEKAINADNVSFKVDPSILGGVIVRVGAQVVDSSVANQMSAMRDSLS